MNDERNAESGAIAERPCRTSTVGSVGDGYFTDDEGWLLGLPDGLDFDVRPGMTVEQWGKGIGFPVRGLAIGGRVVWYQTEEEQRAQEDNDRRRREIAKLERYHAKRETQDAAYEALPDEFRRRIDRFRAGCPEFRWEFEPYELMVCADAVKIAERFGRRADLISEFAEWDYEKQKTEVDIDPGHSVNSFSCAVMLARLWSIAPEAVVKAHGALTPLVGCEEYGCTHADNSD